MIEMRWVVRRARLPHPAMNALDENGHIRTERILQYRTWNVETDGDGINLCNGSLWTDWVDVPVVQP